MAKKSREQKNARRRFAGLRELHVVPPQPPFDVERFALETMLALKTGGSDKVREDLATWHVPVFRCKCGNVDRLLTAGRLFVKGKGWTWVCPGKIRTRSAAVGGVYRAPCGRDLVARRDYWLPWDDTMKAMTNPFRSLHEPYENAVLGRIAENLSSADPDDTDPAAAPGHAGHQPVDAPAPGGTICETCEGRGELMEEGAPEGRLSGPFECPDCKGTGEVGS